MAAGGASRTSAFAIIVVAAWAGSYLISWELTQGVLDAAQLSIFGVVLMLCYITFHLGSLLLAMAGLGGVVVSFSVTW